jgi:hypothetical protein
LEHLPSHDCHFSDVIPRPGFDLFFPFKKHWSIFLSLLMVFFCWNVVFFVLPSFSNFLLMQGDNEKNIIPTFTVEESIESMGFGLFQALVLLYSGMAWVADAMEMMLLSFVGPAVQKTWDLSGTEESFITSVVFVGMMLGAYFWGALSDLQGRR